MDIVKVINGEGIILPNDSSEISHVQDYSVPQSAETPKIPEGSETLKDIESFVKDTVSFFDNELYSDVVLKVGDINLPAHKFVLAKSSRVFQTMLYGQAWKTEGDLVLEETKECQNVFKTFIKFLYCGEVDVRLETAVGLLCLADKYQVESLKTIVAGYMLQWAGSPRVHSALEWYHWAKLLDLSVLQSQCFKTIAWNFSEVVASDEWVKMNIDYVVDLISSSELVVFNEMAVYEAVLAWMNFEETRKEKYAKTLFPLIRFPMMLVSQLYQLEQSSDCHLLSSLLSQAYRFRAVCPHQTNLEANFADVSYLPRDYKYLWVDQVRIQNTMRFGVQSDVKASRSAVPSEAKDADWKITYRKQAKTWSMQLYCLDSAVNNGDSKVQVSVIVYNQHDQVLQVHREETKTCGRGACINIQCTFSCLQVPSHLAVLLKPVAL